MAHSSDAYGTVTLSGTWTPTMCQNFNTIKNAWISWCYSITIDNDFSPSLRTLCFCGLGRWSFHSSLESLDDWCREEFEEKPILATAYLDLLRDMEQHDSFLEFLYVDVEAGSQFISTDTVTFAAKDGHLIIKQSIESPHKYTWENYLSFDFGGEEQFAALVDDLVKLFLADRVLCNADRDLIVEWAKANTIPHDTADCLDEETVAKFKAAFSDLGKNPTN